MSSTGRVIDLLRQSAALNGAAPAIVAAGRKSLSYEELLDQVERNARILLATGMQANDRVAVVGASGPEMVVLVLAVMAIAGCAPLNPSYTAIEFEFYLKDISPRLLITEGAPSPARQVAQRLGIATREVISSGQSAGEFSFAEDCKKIAGNRFADADNSALILHTSGTTGRPKMVPLTQRNLCISALNVARSLALSPNDRCLSVMPMFHIHGLIGAMLSTFASGGSLACAGMFRAPAFYGWLKEFEPTWYTATPSMHAAVLERANQLVDATLSHRLRIIRSCSAPLPPQVIAGLEDYFGAPLVEAYGMTEAAHQIASNPTPPGRRKPGSVGIPTGTAIAIMDSTGVLELPGAEGEIVIRGPNVMGSYLATADVNAAAFTDGWFHTGDEGRFDEDGYLFITGRIKEIINRGGEKISPREIDEVLLAHPAVAEAVAFAIPDVRLGEDVGAAVVLKAGDSKVSARSLLNFAETRLAPFKLPRRILFVSEIPRGPTGKPQRVGLAQRLGLEKISSVTELASVTRKPRTPTECTLLRLCRDVFQIKTIGIQDNFFDSGADSLSAMTLLLEVEGYWNITMTIADMFAAPTLAEFAKAIDQAADRQQVPKLAIIQAGGSLPPFFCLGAGPRFRELARLLGPQQPFFAPVDPRPSELQNSRIEDVAAHFVRIMRNAQPHGPYFLGGWCIDGLAAYEAAQQLRAAGEPVALLALFDTSFFESRLIAIYGRYRARVLDIATRAAAIVRQRRWDKILSYLQWRLRDSSERPQRRFGRGRDKELHFDGGWMETANQQRAAEAYRPLPYEGHVLHLRRSKLQSRWTRERQDWSCVIRGEYDTCEIPGDHIEIFEQPHVVFTANKLRRSLDNAQTSFSTSATTEEGRSNNRPYIVEPEQPDLAKGIVKKTG